MKVLKIITKYLIILFIGILYCQSSTSKEPDIAKKVLGNWRYDHHIYQKVGRYGAEEVDSIKSSLLCFKKDKVYFTNLTFLDTCFYSELHPKAFFDREDKEPSYFSDGPLAIKYTEQQLSKFIRIDQNCKYFGTFYLNADTLILDSTGGVTFFFTKSKADHLK